MCCGCGSNEKKAQEEIVGKWVYHTGFTTWNFVFNEDMTCTYWAGTREPRDSTYKMENGKLTIEDLDWDLYYELSKGNIRFWQDTQHDDGSRSQWEFIKDNTYNPSDSKNLALTENMVEEIEAEYKGAHFSTILLTYLSMKYDNLDFTDWKVTNAEKTDPYTYVVYGVVYAENNYGEKYYQNTNITFTVGEDAEESKGYSIDWDIEFVE